jgi:hypothetical protein
VGVHPPLQEETAAQAGETAAEDHQGQLRALDPHGVVDAVHRERAVAVELRVAGVLDLAGRRDQRARGLELGQEAVELGVTAVGRRLAGIAVIVAAAVNGRLVVVVVGISFHEGLSLGSGSLTMMTKRSNHIPMLMKIERMKSQVGLRRSFCEKSDSGKIMLHVSMIHAAHHHSPKTRFQK